MKKSFLPFLLGACIIVLDQATKIFVKLSLAVGEEIPVWGKWLKIHFIENPGAAFGLSLTGIFARWTSDPITAETYAKIGLTFLSLGIVTLLIFYLPKATRKSLGLGIALGVIIGGAIGNLIDRIFYGVIFHPINDYPGKWFLGQVVDFLYVDLWHGRLPESIPLIGGSYIALWPIFNVADMAISISLVVILLFYRRYL